MVPGQEAGVARLTPAGQGVLALVEATVRVSQPGL